MRIRAANLHDLTVCSLLDGAYYTDHVWQMEQYADDHGIEITFRTVRLPREMRVQVPPAGDDLLTWYERGDCLLVAAEEDGPHGYLAATAQSEQDLAWLHHLVVEEAHRRRGLGTALVRGALQWAKELRLGRLMLAVQSKNYPAINFCQQRGFSFCGFNDRYYRNQDIALFFSYILR